MIKLIFKLFGGKISSVFASGILYAAMWIVAHLVMLIPQLAGMIDPAHLAAVLMVAVLAGFNALTNAVHIQAITDINTALQVIQPITEIPVKRAEVLK